MIGTQEPLPTPAFHGRLVARPLRKQVANLLHLRLKHSLDTLRLVLQLTMEILTLLLDLLLYTGKLLATLGRKIRKLALQGLVLGHQLFHLRFNGIHPVRHVILFHGSGNTR